jgi:hypothetical protein
MITSNNVGLPLKATYQLRKLFPRGAEYSFEVIYSRSGEHSLNILLKSHAKAALLRTKLARVKTNSALGQSLQSYRASVRATSNFALGS